MEFKVKRLNLLLFIFFLTISFFLLLLAITIIDTIMSSETTYSILFPSSIFLFLFLLGVAYRYSQKKLVFELDHLKINTIFKNKEIEYNNIEKWTFTLYGIDDGPSIYKGKLLTIYEKTGKTDIKHKIRISDLKSHKDISDALGKYTGGR